MQMLKACYINEIEKMLKRKKALIVLILSLLTIVFGQLLVAVVRSGLGLRTVSSVDFPLLVLEFMTFTILPLFTVLVSIDLFAGEFSNNTMKLVISKPLTRFQIFTSKILAIFTFVLANLLVVMILSTISGFLFNAYSLNISSIFKIVISYIITAFPMLAFAMIIVMFSNIFRSGTGIFFLSILIFILFKGLGFVFSNYSSIFITSMFNWYNLWIADTSSISKIVREAFILIGYGITFFTASYYLFDKKEL